MRALVACVGNIFQGDDAFGCEVAKLLASKALEPDIQVIDFGIRSLDLTYALLDARPLTILVDAVSRGGAPGTLYVIEPNLDDVEDSAGELVDAHALDPVQVLRLVKAMGGTPGRILLLGCEAEDVGGREGRMGLTPAVSASVDQAAEMIISLVNKELMEVTV